jgi:cytochrome P450
MESEQNVARGSSSARLPHRGAQLRALLDSDAFQADPHSVLREMRGSGPAHRIEPEGAPAQWLITTYREARAVLSDPRVSKRSDSAGLERGWLVNGTRSDAQPEYLLTVDPPEHSRLRGLVLRSFTAGRLKSMRPRLEQIAREMIDELTTREDADLVDDFAMVFPLSAICELLGVPTQDGQDFRTWSNIIVAPTAGVEMETAFASMADYLTALVAAKRADPGADLLSSLITDVDEDKLTDDELVGMAFVLLVAGHSTTAVLLATASLRLMRDPELAQSLRDHPEQIPLAVEEFLRFDSPVQITTERFATEEMAIGEVQIQRGDMLIVALNSANRDTARFEGADEFDLSRNTIGHLGFGHGIHHCLGAPLARLEAEIALRALLEILPNLELTVSDEDIEWLPGLLVHGPAHLPVRRVTYNSTKFIRSVPSRIRSWW